MVKKIRDMQGRRNDELVRAWHRFFANLDDKEQREPDLWAVQYVTKLLPDALSQETNDRIVDDPERMWLIILLLVKAAPNRRNLLAVCGPLRQFLESYFDKYIDAVTDESQQNQRLAYALSHTLIQDDKFRELIRLLGRSAAVMHFVEDDKQREEELINQLVKEWFRWIRTEAVDEKALWAIDQIGCELPFYDPNLCWRVILQLVSESQSKAELKVVSNVIEQLLMFNYADFISSLKQEALNNEKLVYALTQVDIDLNCQGN